MNCVYKIKCGQRDGNHVGRRDCEFDISNNYKGKAQICTRTLKKKAIPVLHIFAFLAIEQNLNKVKKLENMYIKLESVNGENLKKTVKGCMFFSVLSPHIIPYQQFWPRTHIGSISFKSLQLQSIILLNTTSIDVIYIYSIFLIKTRSLLCVVVAPEEGTLSVKRPST